MIAMVLVILHLLVCVDGVLIVKLESGSLGFRGIRIYEGGLRVKRGEGLWTVWTL